jgi:KUP system potassium uptake protein
VNWLQMIVVLLAVIGFGSSDKLAGAYGIAVTATMLATTLLTFFVIRYRWHLAAGTCALPPPVSSSQLTSRCSRPAP